MSLLRTNLEKPSFAPNYAIMVQEILALLRKELVIEWKQKYAFNGLVMYVLCMVIVIAVAFGKGKNPQTWPQTWTVIFWIIMLFVAINSVAKSFLAEDQGQRLYLYSLASATSIILAKIIYNLVLLMIMATVALLAFRFLGDIEIFAPWTLWGIALLGSMALSANLTLISAIAAQADNRSTLLAVLGFPILVPILLVLIRMSRYAVEGLGAGIKPDQLWLLVGITLALATISVILFPFVWRD